MAVTSEVAEKLRALPEAAAVALRMKAEHYFDVIRAMLDVFAILGSDHPLVDRYRSELAKALFR